MVFFRRTTLWPAMLPTPWVINLATLFRLGIVTRGRGPGTWGSVAGLIVYITCFHYTNPFLALVLLLAFTWFAVGICGEAEVRMARRDPGEVILDEVVAIPYCFLGLQTILNEGTTWFWVLVGLIIFRIFDVLKPLGISRLQGLPGGWGVVVDDVAAALATCICLHLLAYWLGAVPF